MEVSRSRALPRPPIVGLLPRLMSVALLPLLFATTFAGAQAPPAAQPTVTVTIDSTRRVVHLVLGPYRIEPAAAGHAGHQMSGMDHGAAGSIPFLRFTWPNTGWLRGVSLTVRDADGKPLDRRLIHHFNLMNLSRRQLLYPAIERTIAMGRETEDIRLPATVGIPVRAGMPMGAVVAWHNEGHHALDGVTLEAELEWLPTTQQPRPLDVLPLYVDVQYPVASPVEFDLPPGPQAFSTDFTMPLSGRIIGIGGHLHDFGTALVLGERRGASIRRLVALDTRRDPDGTLRAVERQLPGVRGRGIRLVKDRSYQMIGSYDNTTGATIPNGAMVHLIMLFAPDRVAEWPAADLSEPEIARDLAALERRGGSVRAP